MSCVVKVNVQLLELSAASVESKVTVTALPAPLIFVDAAGDCVTVGDASQLSEVVALPVKSGKAALQEASTFPLWLGGQVIDGGVWSAVVKVKVQVLEFKDASVASNETVTEVPAPLTAVPEAGDCVTVGDASQLSETVALPVKSGKEALHEASTAPV